MKSIIPLRLAVRSAFGVLLMVGLLAGAGRLNAQGNFEWFEAARMGDTRELRRQLAAGVNIDQAGNNGMTALHHALAMQQREAVGLLVEEGANLKVAASTRLPLNWAVQAGDLESVRLLLDKGADPRGFYSDEPGGRGWTALDDAVVWGRLEMVKELEARKVGVNTLASMGIAAWWGHLDLVDYFLAKGADVNGLFRSNVALDHAAANGDIPLIERLLKAGARVDAVSNGEAVMADSGVYERTPLVSAVIAGQREAVGRLLKAGADAKALDNLAIQWADVLGDGEIYEALRKAGAPEPQPFGFARWLRNDGDDESVVTGEPALAVAPPEPSGAGGRVSAGEAVASELARLGTLRASEVPAGVLPEGTKVAVVALGSGMEDAEALLAVKLSALDGAVVLERAEVKKLVDERQLATVLGRTGGGLKMGRFLGADVLVLLKRETVGKTVVVESRVIATQTGVVAGAAHLTKKAGLKAWADETAGLCRAAGAILAVPPEGVRLVAVPRVVASVNTARGRGLEREVSVVLAARLAKVPGVLTVERAALDQLALEKDPRDAAYSASSWLVDATLDVPMKGEGPGGAVTLRVTLRNGGGGRTEHFMLTGKEGQTGKLADEAALRIGEILKTPVGGEWSKEKEAAALWDKAQRFAGVQMWVEAAPAAEAAWALGMQTDAVANFRMQGAVLRLQGVAESVIPKRRERSGFYGPGEFVSLQAPLLMSPMGARRAGSLDKPKTGAEAAGVEGADTEILSLDELLETSNRALDIYADWLPKLGVAIAGMPASKWLCGSVWHAASGPLHWTESISYQRTHGQELAALRGRLLALNTEAIGVARARNDALALQTLIAVRIRELVWWQPDERLFRAEVRRLLKDSLEWRGALSEQTAWTAAWEAGKERTRGGNNRARRAWIRLAREMQDSPDIRERYFGRAMTTVDTLGMRRHFETLRTMVTELPALSALDRGINASIYCVGVEGKAALDAGLVKSCGPWYFGVFKDVEWGGMWAYAKAGMGMSTQSPYAQSANAREGVELRGMYYGYLLKRLESIRVHGSGGIPYINLSKRAGYTDEQLDALLAAFKETLPVLQALAAKEPQAASAAEGLAMLIKHYRAVDRRTATSVVLDVGPLRNPFIGEYASLPVEQREWWTCYIKNRRSVRVVDGWHFLQVVTDPRRDDALRELYVFRFDAQGDITDKHRLMTDFTIDQEWPAPAPVSSRWMVMPGAFYDPESLYDSRIPRKEAFLVVDRETWKTREFPASSSPYGLRHARLIGDQLVYAFIYNPTAISNGDLDRLEKTGDPTFGVAAINLNTGKETLLVSSRRQPAVAPVETEKMSAYMSLPLVSETAFTVLSRNYRSHYAYDFSTAEWRRLTPADKVASKADEATFWVGNEVEAGGLKWRIHGVSRAFELMVSTTGLGNMDIKLKGDYRDYKKNYREWPRAISGVGEGEPDMQQADTYLADNGLAIWMNGGFYFWVPKEKLQVAIMEAYGRKKAQMPTVRVAAPIEASGSK